MSDQSKRARTITSEILLFVQYNIKEKGLIKCKSNSCSIFWCHGSCGMGCAPVRYGTTSYSSLVLKAILAPLHCLHRWLSRHRSCAACSQVCYVLRTDSSVTEGRQSAIAPAWSARMSPATSSQQRLDTPYCRPRSPLSLQRRLSFLFSPLRNSSRYDVMVTRGLRRLMNAAALFTASGVQSNARTRSIAAASSVSPSNLFRNSSTA